MIMLANMSVKLNYRKMALAWISGVFRRFVRFFADNLEENQHVSTNEASGMGSYSPAEAGGTHSESLDNEYWREATHSESFDSEFRKEAALSELFDNEYRRNAQKHVELRAECFAKADKARKSGDHATANAYVRQVRQCLNFSPKLHPHIPIMPWDI